MITNQVGDLQIRRYNGTQIFINDPTELTDSCPIGLAIDNSGFFYVALQATNKIIRYDPSTYSFDYPISSGTTILTAAEGLNGPCGLKFDSSNYLYVANRLANTVLKYDISNIGSPILLQTIMDPSFLQPTEATKKPIQKLKKQCRS